MSEQCVASIIMSAQLVKQTSVAVSGPPPAAPIHTGFFDRMGHAPPPINSSSHADDRAV